MAPTNDQIQTVVREWAAADHENFVKILYQKMFDRYPEYAKLFKEFKWPVKDTDSGFNKQVKEVAAAMDKMMNLAKAGEMDKLMEALRDTATAHAGYQVHQTHFQSLKPILGDVLAAALPKADKTAWRETMCFMLDNMTTA